MDALNPHGLAGAGALRPYTGRTYPANENRRESDGGLVKIGGSTGFWIFKRCLDIVFSVLIVPVLAIFSALLLVLNPLFNPGPLLYSQSRIGLYGRPFSIVKFRTMIPEPQGTREVFSKEDHRITSFAWFLRKFRIDELPQVLNVLRGQMSLIGPRPEMIEIVQRFEATLPGFSLRHAVRPGISGLSQVTIGYTDCELSYSQKLECDLHYIREAGWAMEGRLFVTTLWVVMTGFGAR